MNRHKGKQQSDRHTVATYYSTVSHQEWEKKLKTDKREKIEWDIERDIRKEKEVE